MLPVTRFSLQNEVLVSVTVLVASISQFGFRFRTYTKIEVLVKHYVVMQESVNLLIKKKVSRYVEFGSKATLVI